MNFDTYEKSQFVAQHGCTIYLPEQYAKMPVTLLMSILGKKYPILRRPYKILQTSVFTSEGPGYIPGRRSRIGDMILLIEGSKKFMAGLETFNEDHRFRLSGNWRIQIRGGKRIGQGRRNSPDLELSEGLQSLVMQASADETMEQTKRNSERMDDPNGL